MPKTNMVSAFRCTGTWRRWWLFLHCCQGCISVKLFLPLVSGIISLVPLHACCDILMDAWKSSGTTWALFRCAGWGTSSHHSLKPLKGCKAPGNAQWQRYWGSPHQIWCKIYGFYPRLWKGTATQELPPEQVSFFQPRHLSFGQRSKRGEGRYGPLQSLIQPL